MCTYDIIPHAGRIRHLILLLVVMLVAGFVPAATAAIASFTADPISGPAETLVQFTDSSTPSGVGGVIDKWTLDYGDGSTPYVTTTTWGFMYHTYNETGTFQVNLTVNESGYPPNSTTRQISIYPNASFYANPEDGYLPITPGASLLVTFTDNSTGTPDMWTWDFGDGSPFVWGHNQPSINHSYTLAGRFEVEMTAYKDGLAGTPVTRQVVVRPGSNYTWVPTATIGEAPMIWTYQDSSTGSPNAWNWSFGDGSAANIQNPPAHTFNKAGIFPVSLTASNTSPAIGGVVEGSPITRSFTVRPNASFAMSRSRGTVPLGVQFTSTTLGVPGYGAWANTTYSWNFGDGNTSTEQNPFHAYVSPGRYTVTFTVTSGEGSTALSDTATASVWVNTARMPPFRVSIYNTFNPLLKANKAHVLVNEPVTFFAYVSRPVPTATAVDNMIYAWYYGDGYNPQTGQPNVGSVDVLYGPHGWVTNHAYAEPGSYPVACAVVNPVGDPTIAVPTPYTLTLPNIPLPGGGTANVNIQITVPAGYKLPDAMAYTVVYMPDFVEVRR